MIPRRILNTRKTCRNKFRSMLTSNKSSKSRFQAKNLKISSSTSSSHNSKRLRKLFPSWISRRLGSFIMKTSIQWLNVGVLMFQMSWSRNYSHGWTLIETSRSHLKTWDRQLGKRLIPWSNYSSDKMSNQAEWLLASTVSVGRITTSIPSPNIANFIRKSWGTKQLRNCLI